MSRLEDLQRFYEILRKLERKIGCARTFADSDWQVGLPERGVYFFREPGEERPHTGGGLRVVRVGISTATKESKATLRTRLRQHRRDNHRSSVFRKHIGRSLIERDGLKYPKWDCTDKDLSPLGSAERKAIKENEAPLEQRVSAVIGPMQFLWLAVEEFTLRKSIERNAIALLSNFDRDVLDPPSSNWLGKWHTQPEVRDSGLWNIDHVDKEHKEGFLDVLESAVDEMRV